MIRKLLKHIIVPSGYAFHIKGRDDVIKIHITKTAGTSLSKALRFNTPNNKKGFKKHHFAREVIDLIGQDKWSSAIRFSFVRNPWDRMYSYYRFKKRKGKVVNDIEKDSFSAWLKNMLPSMEGKPYHKARPQTEWLIDHDGNIDYHFIGRFEKMEEEIKRLSELLETPINLPVINRSYPIIHYSSAYNDETIALVEEHYRSDIKMFNYSFELKK